MIFSKTCIRIVSLLIGFSQVSCNDSIEETFIASNSSIVINGFFSSQDTTRINVSLIQNMWDNSKDSFINDANVSLKVPDGTIITLGHDTSKYWRSDYKKGFYRLPSLLQYQPGIYELTVTVPGKGTVSAKDSIPIAVPLNRCVILHDSINKKYLVQANFSDPAQEKNFYSLTVNAFIYSSVWNYTSVNDSVKSTYCYKYYNVPLSTPNTYVEAPINSSLNQLIFSDKSFNGGKGVALTTALEASFQNNYMDSTVFYIQLHSISKAYYNYAISYYKQNQAEKDFYAEPVNVYSNITGGYGIFAGYSTSELKIKITK